MKFFFVGLMLLSTSISFAGDIQVNCGELIRYRQGSKSILEFPASILIPLRLPALKVKMRNVSSHTKTYGDPVISSEPVKKKRVKLSYSDETNLAKHVALLKEAKEEIKLTKGKAFVCFGEVKGLDRWHKILSYSMDSKEEALAELIKKYH